MHKGHKGELVSCATNVHLLDICVVSLLYMQVWVQNHTCAVASNISLYVTEVLYVQTWKEVLEVSKNAIINEHIIL